MIEQVNQLDVPTVVHLHGGHTPAASDGWPLDLLMPAGEHHDTPATTTCPVAT